MMKKILILSIAIVAVAAVGLGAFGIAGAAGIVDLDLPALQGRGPRAEYGRMYTDQGDGPLAPYVQEATAEILGITVEELEAAYEDGQRLSDLVEEAGLTIEEYRLALEEAWPGIVGQALADGAITEDGAERLLAMGIPGHQGRFGPLGPYVLDATAEALGMDADELQAALDEGVTMDELLEEADLSHRELRMALDAATPEIVRLALADEAITEELAEQVLEYGLPFGLGGHGHRGPGGHSGPGEHHGPGGFGPGGFGPGGFGPGGPQGFGPGEAPFFSDNG